MGKVMNHNQFIEKLKKDQPHVYESILEFIDEYTKLNTKIRIRDKYGIILAKPVSMLKGCKPSIASAVDKTAYWVSKAKVVHGNEYGYEKTKYESTDGKVIIVCQKHGEFNQSPKRHGGGQGCPKCGRDKISKYNSKIRGIKVKTSSEGRNCVLKQIARMLRHKTEDWILRTKEFYNSKCELTGKLDIEVHHLNNLNGLIRRVIIRDGLAMDILINQTATSEQIYGIVESCSTSKEFLELGVCLDKGIHRFFHKLYGNSSTKEDYYEFKSKFLDGEFDEYFKE